LDQARHQGSLWSGGDKDATDKDWDAAEKMLLGVLEIYTQKDVWTTVSDDTMFKT
jgi:hypothetical protein